MALNVRVCRGLKTDLSVRDVELLKDKVLDIVNSVGGLVYIRLSYVVGYEVLDIFRGILSVDKLGGYIALKLNSPHISELIKNVVGSVELVVTDLDVKEFVVGDLYLKDTITPTSYALTYHIFRYYEDFLFDDSRINICSVSRELELIGCLIKDSTYVLDNNIIKSVLNMLKYVVKDLGSTSRFITWVLSSDELLVIDY
jgi:hypothetical protein